MRLFVAVVMLGASLLAGCTAPYTEAPHSIKFDESDQRKLQSAHHWQVIADDAARQVLQQLESTRCVPNQPVCRRGLHEGTKLYIKPKATDNQFHRAFKISLRSALLKANLFRITKNPHDENVLMVDVDTEYVRWAGRAHKDPFVGEMTALATGLWVLRNASTDVALLGAGVSADIYFAKRSRYSRGPRPRHELMVSVTVSDSQYYYADSVNVYYTTERDFHNLYAEKKPPLNLPGLPSNQVHVTD